MKKILDALKSSGVAYYIVIPVGGPDAVATLPEDGRPVFEMTPDMFVDEKDADPEPAPRFSGNALVNARDNLGWSQDTLAKVSGVGKSTIQRIERFETENPQMSTVSKLADVMCIDVNDLYIAP
jgi:DNA-binding XRE family transcriptional regulator